MKYKTDEQIAEFLTPFAKELGVTVYDVSFKKGKNQLDVTIDKAGGVDLDTCAAFMEKVNLPLDKFDPTFGESYTLNVSSKGIDWAFKTADDFTSHIGQRVEVKLIDSVRGKKFYDGILTAYDGKTATLKVNEKITFTLDMKNVLKMNEYIDFE